MAYLCYNKVELLFLLLFSESTLVESEIGQDWFFSMIQIFDEINVIFFIKRTRSNENYLKLRLIYLAPIYKEFK